MGLLPASQGKGRAAYQCPGGGGRRRRETFAAPPAFTLVSVSPERGTGAGAWERVILSGKRPSKGRNAVENQGPDGVALADLLGGVTGEAFIRAMLDTLPQIAFVIRPDGSAEYYNRALRDFAGAVLGSDMLSRTALLHPEDRERLLAARAAAVAIGSAYTVEARLRRHDGVYRWHIIRNAPMDRAGATVAWLGTAVDVDDMRRANELLEQQVAERTERLSAQIAERARAQAVLEDSEARYRALYNRTPMALHSVDAAARIIDVNDHWCQLFGYAREDVLGRSPTDFMPEESAQLYRDNAWPDMLDSSGAVRSFEYRFRKRTGEQFHGRLSSRGEWDAQGRFVRTWAATADITAQKQAEAQLVQAQKMEVVGQLTGGVAHDFNNLLTAVLGNLELLERRTREPTSARYVQAARRSAERGAKLTEQLLAFSRKQHLQPRAIDANRIVAGMGELLGRTMGGTIQVRTALDPQLWPALLDPTQIELMILNLAINARDAMPLGGTLTIATANVAAGMPGVPAEISQHDSVILSVSDTGVGMSADVLARAFEPFFTTKDVGKGSGLGLSQVYGLMKQSGGAVRIDSRPGHGTTVWLYLLRAAEAAADERGAPHAAAARAGGRILVVDDDADVRDITVQLLREGGYAVAEAHSGLAALAALERGETYDLVVVDIAMAGLNGIETVRQWRERRPGLRVLFITGYADTSMFDAQTGADPVLKKPFSRDALTAAVQDGLRRSSAAPSAKIVPIRSTKSE
jgi:PAS domain S-box-containing protein